VKAPKPRPAPAAPLAFGELESLRSTTRLHAVLGSLDPSRIREQLSQASDVPEAEAAELLDAQEGDVPGYRWQSIGSVWGRRDPDAALAFMDRLDTEARSTFFKGLVQGWARRDPAVVIARLTAAFRAGEDDSLLDGMNRPEVVAAVLEALTDSPDAVFWGGSGGVLVSVGDGSKARSDHAELATEWLKTLKPGEDYEPSDAHGVAVALVAKDVDEALAWVKSLDDKQTRESALAGFVKTLAKTDPARAARFLDKDGPGDWFKVNEVRDVLEAYMQKDPAAAARWWENRPLEERPFGLESSKPETFDAAAAFLGALSEPQKHLQAFASVGMHWGKFDPVRAVAWARELPEQNLQTTVLRGILTQFASSDPRGAAMAAASLDDAPLRAEILATAGKNWAAMPRLRRWRTLNEIRPFRVGFQRRSRTISV